MATAGLATRTLLFTDMVGSTELRLRLGEDRADRLRKAHDELTAAAIDKHGGTVLRWTGDGVKASFPTSSAAVSAALALQRAVHAYARRSDAVAAFEIRVGLSVGEVRTEDGDEHGVAVIEAARLEAIAAPGEILATDLVQRLGDRRSEAQFEHIGSRSLKGIDHPVVVVRVVDTGDVDAVPMPRTITFDQRFPMVGRASVMERIGECWQAACDGTVATVLITGQPGMGKSRVIAQAAQMAHAEGALVLAGICDSDRPVPYQPLAMAFADALGGGATASRDGESDEHAQHDRHDRLGDPTLTEAFTARSGPLAPLFPGTRAVRPDEQVPAARFDLFDAVTALLERLTNTQPVVLVLEDLHWATPPTLLLLKHVVAHLDGARLLVLGTYRDEEVASNAAIRDLLAEIQSVGSASRFELAALDDGDVGRMINSIVPHAVDVHVAELAQRLREESAGNAFFVCELIDHLAAVGELERLVVLGDGGGGLPIPDSVRDVVGERVGRLPTDAADMVTTAATIGLSFDLDLVARVSGASVEQTLERLEEIERVALINEVGAGRYSFVHAIVRTTLLARMSATRRALAHRDVAIAIESLDGQHHDELAHHWLLAGDEAKAYANLALAARRDLRALAYESAADRYQQVLDFAERHPGDDDTDLEATACLGVGLARRALGHADFLPMIERAGRLARKRRNVELMSDAALATIFPGGFFPAAGQTETGSIELCEDAIDALDDTDARKVRIMSTLAAHLTFDSDRDRRVELISRASKLAREHGDPELIGGVLCAEFICLWDPTTAARRAEIGQHVGRMARASGDTELEFLAGFFSAFCAAEHGDVADSRRRLEQLDGVIAASRNFYFRFLADRLTVSLDLLSCRPDIQQSIDRLAADFAHRHADTTGTWALQTGMIALRQGRLGSFADTLAVMVAESSLSGSWSAAYGLALLTNGDRDGAEAVLDASTTPQLDYLWMSTMQGIADLAVRLGRVDRCQELLTELMPFRGQLGIASSGSLCYGLVSLTLGQLALTAGRPELAVELLDESSAQADAMGAPYDAAVARRDLARAMHALGHRGRDVERIAAEAQALFDEHGFAGDHDLLGAAPSPSPTT